jgi:tetratricopeptide (TPR) repeat protein
MCRCHLLFLFPLVALLSPLTACNKDAPLDEFELFSQNIHAMQTDDALDTLHTLVDAAGPVDGFARYHLGTIHYSLASDGADARGWNDQLVQAHLDSAEVWFNAAIAADSTMIRAYVNLGSIWDDRAEMMLDRKERDARIAKARALYEQALELDPHDEKARCNLGTLYKRQNDMQRAMEEYLAVLEHDPRSALARYNLAILFATQRIYREAKLEFELAAKSDPNGDIGERSRYNIKIINDLEAAGDQRRAR